LPPSCPAKAGEGDGRFLVDLAIQTLVSLLAGTASTVVRAFSGAALRPVLTSERLVRAFIS
jgi:hypothetical protein